MNSRLGIGSVATILFATPAFAHGGGLIFAFVAVAWVLPAAIALLLPWARWRTRLTVVVVPVAIAAAGLAVWFRTDTDRWPHPLGDILVWLIFFGPAAVISVLAAVLYWIRRQGAA